MDRRERENNIVIRGVDLNQKNLKERVEAFLKERLEVTRKVDAVRISGRVTVVKVSKKMKTEIMKKKSRLVESRIYIENEF